MCMEPTKAPPFSTSVRYAVAHVTARKGRRVLYKADTDRQRKDGGLESRTSPSSRSTSSTSSSVSTDTFKKRAKKGEVRRKKTTFGVVHVGLFNPVLEIVDDDSREVLKFDLGFGRNAFFTLSCISGTKLGLRIKIYEEKEFHHSDADSADENELNIKTKKSTRTKSLLKSVLKIVCADNYSLARIIFTLTSLKKEASFSSTCFLVNTCILGGKEGASSSFMFGIHSCFFDKHRHEILQFFPNAFIPVLKTKKDVSKIEGKKRIETVNPPVHVEPVVVNQVSKTSGSKTLLDRRYFPQNSSSSKIHVMESSALRELCYSPVHAKLEKTVKKNENDIERLARKFPSVSPTKGHMKVKKTEKCEYLKSASSKSEKPKTPANQTSKLKHLQGFLDETRRRKAEKAKVEKLGKHVRSRGSFRLLERFEKNEHNIEYIGKSQAA